MHLRIIARESRGCGDRLLPERDHLFRIRAAMLANMRCSEGPGRNRAACTGTVRPPVSSRSIVNNTGGTR